MLRIFRNTIAPIRYKEGYDAYCDERKSNSKSKSFYCDTQEYKINYGLDQTQMEGKLFQIISPIIDNLIIDLQKIIRFFTQNHPEQKIKRIVLSGGPAQMKGLVEKISKTLNLEVVQAAPFAKAKGQLPETNQLSFSVCMGLIARKL